MSESENFLARWSRLKRDAALQVSGVNQPASAAPLPVADEPTTRAFDPASLPSVDMIGAATDIRAFLEPSVPEELTRAALRSTWSADPAIRDFVGIAESQWDFNDPASIPGFGAHTAADCLASLAMLGAGSPDTAAASPAADTDPTGDERADVAAQVTAATGHVGEAEPVARHSAADDDRGPRIVRAHGSALPE